MTSPLPTSAAPSLQLLVRGGRQSRLTSDDVGAIHRLLRRQSHRPCDTHVTYGQGVVIVRVSREVGDDVVETTSVDDDGHTTTTTTTFRRAGEHITSLRRPEDMAAMISACLTKTDADAQKYGLDTTSPCARGDACEYVQSLKMRLHDTIHASYLKALALLVPCTSAGTTGGGSFMRSILVAGHCYGSMDPVSNIIVNSIWYLTRHPLPEPDRSKIEPYTDILDTLSLLRTEVRSLKGLTELVHAAADAASPGPGSSTAWALETLCHAQCDLFEMLSSSRNLAKKHFQEAGMAAGHPLPADLALLHQQLLLRPRVLGELRALTSQTSTVVSIDHIASILDKALRSSTPRLVVQMDLEAPEMHAKALSAVSRKRSKYDARRSFLRSRLEQLLENYASQHFWEPRYRVNFICGVEALGGGTTTYGRRYAVNFMAASESPLQINTLFFAEFGESEPGHWFGNRGPYAAEPKPDFCCPLPPPYTGRCYYGPHSARKLVYSNLVGYLKADITAHGTDNVADMLETDLGYFSSEGDVEFAEKLNIYYQPDSSAWSRPFILDDEESSRRPLFSSILPFCKQPELA